VIFLTDGYWRKEDHDTIHKMANDNEIQEAIVVGIGYPDNYNFDQIRVRDLIMHADKFLFCIKYEIIPYIESNYRADPEFRTLWGSSYAGYFLVYAFTEPEDAGKLFANYICASAALDPPYRHIDLLNNEDILYSKTKELPVNLYITVGGNETGSFTASYNQITSRIRSRNYKNLRFEYEIIPNTDHYTVWKPALINGLKKFLKLI
ncbi:MAG TPA: alpha/beta hydrolase-fold protein, partial [Ignavibacteriaceae bacterium]|nr:alpha/beta hydrolase-fold protein [Ignavibacteriaceae bacterium]